MSIISNYQIKPVLKLSKNPVMDNSRSLFDRFTNPGNRSDLSLKETGTITAVFDKQASKLINNGGELPCYDADFLGRVMDPKGKLKEYWGKLSKIHGNCTVDQAQVILLSDPYHLDRGLQLVRGEVANALKGKQNIYLCETYPSNKVNFSQGEIDRCFATNLQLQRKEDHLSGWDDRKVYEKSLALAAKAVHQIELSRDPSIDPKVARKMQADGLRDIEKVTGELAFVRTVSLWNCIKAKHRAFPNAVIIVFGGIVHLSEKWLHERLTSHGLRFAEIIPSQLSEPTKEELENYYQKHECEVL